MTSLRSARVEPDLWRPIGVSFEQEPAHGGRMLPALTVFLAGAECPFSCVFCDLWQHTTVGPTPLGALPAQLELALAELEVRETPLAETQIKLYNASNFYDDRAVPAEDRRLLLQRLRDARQVTVECHPRLIRESDLAESREALGAARLEVAVGLETAHPDALRAMRKGADLADFRRAASRLEAAGVGLRVFLLLGAPFVEQREQERWLRRSIRFALELGAGVVALIPLRAGDPLQAAEKGVTPAVEAPSLERVEELCEVAAEEWGLAANEDAVLLLDPWDLETLGGPPEERSVEAGLRLERLQKLGSSGIRPLGLGARAWS